MEQGEWTFCSLWTRSIKPFCGRLLVNASLSSDYFFNRCSLEGCQSPESAIDDLRSLCRSHGIGCAVYDRSGRIETKGLVLLDVMYTLIRSGDNADVTPSGMLQESSYKIIKANDHASQKEWATVFCKSFGLMDWLSEVVRIASADKFQSEVELTLARSGGKSVACMATHTYQGLVGIYCLGTLPEFRRKGAASTLLRMAARNQPNDLYLQSLRSERTRRFYEREGFALKYSKSIYALEPSL